MGIDIELWRARIGISGGGKGSRKLRALHMLNLRNSVAWTTGETTSCRTIALHASIACMSLWMILCFLSSYWNKINSTHLTMYSGELSYHWSKDTKAPMPTMVSVAVVAIAVLLLSLTILLIRSGDVELNRGESVL